jgi:protein-L-isoaspartate(D-aspartate) O-methyltransferase
MTALEQTRRAFAEEIRVVSHIQSDALIEAFAAVPRENFIGPGPWLIPDPDSLPGGKVEYWQTASDDPRFLYHNVPVALDAARTLNNGQPSALALWIDRLSPRAGERVLHVGCGVGYYTAILAHVVGAGGKVTAIELDADLARRAAHNLAHLRQVEVVAGDGTTCVRDDFDVGLVNAGATALIGAWLAHMAPGGRLLVPFTVSLAPGEMGTGLMLRVERTDDRADAAHFVSGVGIYPCMGARDPNGNARLREMMMKGGWRGVRSVRVDTHEPNEGCTLHLPQACLSTELPLASRPLG